MADDAPAGAGGPAKGKEGGLLKSLVDLATDWKVVVTAIAAGTSVFFSFEERDRKRLEVNQEAIGYVRQTETLNRFWNDPANTINEIPRHRDPPLRRQLFHHHRGWGRGAVLGKERRIKIDSAETGPPPGVPVVLGAGMMGDRISVIFASIDDLRRFLVEKC